MERDAISIDRWGLGRGDGRDARSSRVDDDEGTDESATLWTVHRRGADASVRVGERGRGDSGRRRWGSRTFGETNGVTGSGSERIAGVGGEDGERGGVPGSASWSGTAIIADTSGDRGGSGGGGGGAGDGGATSAVPVDPDEILGVFFRGENIPMAMAGEAPVGVGRGRGGGARRGWNWRISRCYGRASLRALQYILLGSRRHRISLEFADFDIELLPLDGGPETRGAKPRDIATRARSARGSTRTERRAS